MSWGSIASVSEAWREALRDGGLEDHVASEADLRRVGRLSRVQRQMLRVTGLNAPAEILEIGVGGGRQLVPLALRGFRCQGVDTSPHAIRRLEAFVGEIRAYRELTLEGHAATFPDWASDHQFDLVFHSGLIHQVLDRDERARFHRRAVQLSRGFVIVIVSSHLVGRHDAAGFTPVKALGALGGHDVPAVPYTPELLSAELTAAGLQGVRVVPINVGGRAPPLARVCVQAFPRVAALNRWATAFLAVGRVCT